MALAGRILSKDSAGSREGKEPLQPLRFSPAEPDPSFEVAVVSRACSRAACPVGSMTFRATLPHRQKPQMHSSPRASLPARVLSRAQPRLKGQQRARPVCLSTGADDSLLSRQLAAVRRAPSLAGMQSRKPSSSRHGPASSQQPRPLAFQAGNCAADRISNETSPVDFQLEKTENHLQASGLFLSLFTCQESQLKIPGLDPTGMPRSGAEACIHPTQNSQSHIACSSKPQGGCTSQTA